MSANLSNNNSSNYIHNDVHPDDDIDDLLRVDTDINTNHDNTHLDIEIPTMMVEHENDDDHLLLSPPISTPTGDTPIRLRFHSPPGQTTQHNPRNSSTGRTSTGRTSTGRTSTGRPISAGGNGGGGDSRSSTPSSYVDLANRPRSNPRTRTPMRTNVNVLNLSSVRDVYTEEEEDYEPSQYQNQYEDRIPSGGVGMRSVGLGAGLAVGTVLRRDTVDTLRQMNHRRQERTTSQPLSQKQGPAQRKLRRWNNDKFIGIASEISHANSNKYSSSSNQHHNTKISKILRIYTEADMEHGMYGDDVGSGGNPYTMPHVETRDNNKCTAFETLLLNGKRTKYPSMDDHVMAGDEKEKPYDPILIQRVKERFLDGQMPQVSMNQPTQKSIQRKYIREEAIYADGRNMLMNVQERLCKVVKRACVASEFSRKVLVALEQFVISHLGSDTNSNCNGSSSSRKYDDSILDEILLQKPLITHKSSPNDDGTNSTKTTIRFLFHTTETSNNINTKGRHFHRLLLTAACQYHGLTALPSQGPRNSRILTVTGTCRGCSFSLLDYLLMEDEEEEVNDETTKEKEKFVVSAASVAARGGDGDSASTTPTNVMVESMATLKVS